MFEQGLFLQDHLIDVQSVAVLSLICSVCEVAPGSSAVRQRGDLLAAAWLSTTRRAQTGNPELQRALSELF